MLSPGCEYSAARNVSWKSSSRTATPLAHAAPLRARQPVAAEDGAAGAAAGTRVGLGLGAGRDDRLAGDDAAATAALSITRLMTMSVTSAVGSSCSAALGDLPGELALACEVLVAAVYAYFVGLRLVLSIWWAGLVWWAVLTGAAKRPESAASMMVEAVVQVHSGEGEVHVTGKDRSTMSRCSRAAAASRCGLS